MPNEGSVQLQPSDGSLAKDPRQIKGDDPRNGQIPVRLAWGRASSRKIPPTLKKEVAQAPRRCNLAAKGKSSKTRSPKPKDPVNWFVAPTVRWGCRQIGTQAQNFTNPTPPKSFSGGGYKVPSSPFFEATVKIAYLKSSSFSEQRG